MIDYAMEQHKCDNNVINKFLVAILNSQKRRASFAYQLIQLDYETKGWDRPARPESLTLKHISEE